VSGFTNTENHRKGFERAKIDVNLAAASIIWEKGCRGCVTFSTPSNSNAECNVSSLAGAFASDSYAAHRASLVCIELVDENVRNTRWTVSSWLCHASRILSRITLAASSNVAPFRWIHLGKILVASGGLKAATPALGWCVHNSLIC
jgi:hypothetical protein